MHNSVTIDFVVRSITRGGGGERETVGRIKAQHQRVKRNSVPRLPSTTRAPCKCILLSSRIVCTRERIINTACAGPVNRFSKHGRRLLFAFRARKCEIRRDEKRKKIPRRWYYLLTRNPNEKKKMSSFCLHCAFDRKPVNGKKISPEFTRRFYVYMYTLIIIYLVKTSF